jgi:hypothetical protein
VTLSQQEKNNSADVHAGRLYSSRRCVFGEFESLAYSFAAGLPPSTHV